MTPQAATELLDVIMLDDFVARRDALDTWIRRWVATMEVLTDAKAWRTVLSLKMVQGLMEDEVHAVQWDANGALKGLRMFVLLQEPRAT